jgi:hypothetical protein
VHRGVDGGRGSSLEYTIEAGWLVLMNNIDDSGECCTLPENAVGIVVHDGRRSEAKPRAVAVVWGGKVRPQPSLPYGRWKEGALPAA